MQIAEFGLYLDRQNTGVAPAWQMPDYANEFMACSRYWTKTELTWGGNTTTGVNYWSANHAHRASLRTAPAVSSVSTGVSGFPATPGTVNVNTQYCNESRTANATTSGGVFGSTVTCNARM
jgi:hypothetical protein